MASSVDHKRSKGYNLCQAINCQNNTKEPTYDKDGYKIRFHRFPREAKLAMQWKIRLRRADLDDVSLQNLQQRYLCSAHFADNAYMCPEQRHQPRASLNWNAVPTIWEHQNLPADAKVKPRKPPAKRTAPAPSASASALPASPSTFRKPSTATASKVDTLRKKVWRLEKALERAKTSSKREKALRIKAEAAARDAVRQNSVGDLPERQKVFVQLQLRSAKKKKVAKYSSAELQEAIALYHRGPGAYHHMRTILRQPGMTTLRRRMSCCMAGTGPCSVLMNAIKVRLEASDPLEKIATLCFDGMKISPAVRYWEHEDRYIGFEDLGASGRSDVVADQGLVAALRSIAGKWKMPMAYYLVRNSPKQDRFALMVDECLAAAAAVGVEVLVLTCDQEKTQWAWLESCGVSVETPFIKHPSTGKKVFVYPDVPHCLKNCRNALLTNSIEYEPGQFARWEHFEQFWKLESSNQLRFNEKISAGHVNLALHTKMRVAVAAQTLSRRTAAAMRAYYQMNLLQEEVLQTAEFMYRVGDLFNLGNSVNPYAEDRKASITSANMVEKLGLIQKGMEWIGRWRFFSLKKGIESHRHSFNTGWRVALSTMLHVTPMLLEAGMKHVPLRRLTQDHVENFFCVIRGRNGFNDRPEVTAFRSAVRAVALSDLLRPLNKFSNCEADSDSLLVDVLQSAAAVKQQGCSSAVRAGAAAAASRLGRGTELCDTECVSEDEGDVLPVGEDVLDDDEEDSHISRSEEQVVDMLGGYTVKRLQRQGKLECGDCVRQLLQSQRSVLLQQREFVECTRQALFSSATDLRQFLLHTETVVRDVLRTGLHQEGIGAKITRAVLRSAPPLKCCHSDVAANAVLKLYLRVRLHHQSRLTNASLRHDRALQKKLKKLQS